MDARTQRTLLRVGALLGALVVATGIVAFVPNLDPRLSEAIYGVAIAAALGLEQWLKNSGDNAPPTLSAVNDALQPATIVRGVDPQTITTAGPPRVVAPPSERRV